MNFTDKTTNTFTEPTLFQTSEGVTHEDNHDVTPRTPVRNKARTYENPDPQFLKSERERTLCSPSDDNETFGQGSFKLSTTVSEVEEEEELPEENVYKENLVERNKILQQNNQELLRSNTLKDEELRDVRTEGKQNINEDKYSVIFEKHKTEMKILIQARCDEVAELVKEEIFGKQDRENKYLKDENNCLKDENKYLKDVNEKLVKELTEERTKQEELKICKVCLDEEKKYVIYPCRHYLLCPHCIGKTVKCPVCREGIQMYVEVFDS